MSSEGGFYVQNEIDEVFHCPVCKTRIHPPARLCRRGHLVCRTCFRRLDRGCLSMKRNYAIDTLAKLLRLPCIYIEYGCRFPPMSSIARKSHEIFCQHRPLVCFKSGCVWEEEMPQLGDERSSSVAALEKHIHDAHSSELTFYDSSEISVKLSVTNEWEIVRYVMTHGEVVFLAAVKCRKTNKGIHHVSAGVTHLDRPQRGRPRCFFRVVMKGGDCEITHKAPVLSYMQAWPGPVDNPWEMNYGQILKVKNARKYLTPEGNITISFTVTDLENDVN